MKYKWALKLDSVGEFHKQFQLCFPDRNVMMIYRIGNYTHKSVTRKYLLLMPSLKTVIIDTDWLKIGTYQIEKWITDAENEEDFLQKYMVELI